MTLRIIKPPPYHPKRQAKKEGDYLAFLHCLPCVVSGVYGVQAAHVSFAAPEYGAYGRGKGSKASDRWALPLSPEEHARQHAMNEQEYWRQAGIDPHMLALKLWGLYSEMGEDAAPFAVDLIRKAGAR